MNTQTFWRSKCLAGLAVMALAASIPALAETVNLDGRWDASITQKGGTVIPFRLDISGSVDHLVGTLHNGAADTETTTSASFQNGVLTLQFEHYLTNIEATVKEGELDGKLLVTRRSAINITPGKLSEAPGDVATPFHAKRYVAPSAEAVAKVPNIDGVWEMPHESPKGEKSWRLIVQQNGADIETTVLRVDGDTGGLTGSARRQVCGKPFRWRAARSDRANPEGRRHVVGESASRTAQRSADSVSSGSRARQGFAGAGQLSDPHLGA